MKEHKLYNLIISKEAKIFVDEIPCNIRNKCELVQFEKSKIVALKGNNIKDIYISLQGKMQVKNEFENGFVYSFAQVNSIAYIGAMEVMANEENYTSTLQTITDCVMIKISKNEFEKWIIEDQILTLNVLRFVSSSMYKQSINTGEVLAYPAIHSLISYLVSVYKSEEKDIVYIKKTREEISIVLGFSIRTINRNLKTLKEEDLISVNRKTISISEKQFDKLLDKLDSIK